MAMLVKIGAIVLILIGLYVLYKELEWYVNFTEFEPQHVTRKVLGCMARSKYYKMHGAISCTFRRW